MKSDFRLAIDYSNLSGFKIIVMNVLKSELMTQGIFLWWTLAVKLLMLVFIGT